MSVVAAAIAGGTALVGGAIASRGASKAADKQAESSDASLRLQSKMFKKQNSVAAEMLRKQNKSVDQNALRNLGYAGKASKDARIQAGRLYGDTSRRARETLDDNSDLYRDEMKWGNDRLRDAEAASLKPFQLQSDLGNNALRAYSSNLGLGAAPKGYSLEMNPGSRYLLDEGSKAIEGGAAAGGGLYSGASMEELQRHAMGIAAQDKGQQQSELFNLGGLGQEAAGTMANIRTGTAGNINALRSGYTGALTGARDNYTNLMAQYGANRANGLTAASDTLAQRRIGIGDTKMSALGQARGLRQQLLGSAASNYGAFGGQAIQNKGDAQAAGVMGGTNAWTNALNGGFQTYGMLGGQIPQFGQSQQPFTQNLPYQNASQPLPAGWTGGRY
jgi:hypothetical protein